MLAGAAIMLAAGVLNFVQRARRETPPWDGIRWTETKQGILAETVEPNSSGARSRLLPGDRLLGVSVRNDKYEEISHARDVQMYLDQAQVGGQIHYLIERPSYPEESRYYYADLDNLDASRFGVIERNGKKLHRYRAKDYRIYFEKRAEGITVHRVLHKNTFRDFLFRSKLPVAEDDQLGKTTEFWKLIEQGERTRKAS